MSPTATPEDIKAYQEQVGKNKIIPNSLPPCPICKVESFFFKLHAYRERRFLIIVEMIVEAVYCSLVRFKCPGCNKTFTWYPDFAIPHKHYARQSVVGFTKAYVGSSKIKYEQAVMVDRSAPVYPKSEESGKSLAPSTVHRWVGALGGFIKTAQKALDLILQKNPATSICRDLAMLSVNPKKYRSKAREEILLNCSKLILIEDFFQSEFERSIFTNLARGCAFT